MVLMQDPALRSFSHEAINVCDPYDVIKVLKYELRRRSYQMLWGLWTLTNLKVWDRIGNAAAVDMEAFAIPPGKPAFLQNRCDEAIARQRQGDGQLIWRPDRNGPCGQREGDVDGVPDGPEQTGSGHAGKPWLDILQKRQPAERTGLDLDPRVKTGFCQQEPGHGKGERRYH